MYYQIMSITNFYFYRKGRILSMTKTYRKKRGPWIDILLISTILLLSFFIIYLTVLSDEPLFPHEEAIASIEAESTISEEESSFPGVRIVTDISTDKNMPYALQYPSTNFKALNEQITNYINDSKDYYINMMRIQQDAPEHIGELNIGLQTYAHEYYYSFVLTNKTTLNHSEQHTTIETFLVDIETGQLLDIQTLFNHDVESLRTFATHIQSEILKNPANEGLILEQSLAKLTEADWSIFKRFALKEESLVVYFNEGEVTHKKAGIPSVEMSLSFINPLLASDFQIAMEAEETISPKNNLDPSKKYIALTFDDGPHPQVTKQILQLLDKYNVKATFFMLGSRIQFYPTLVKEVQMAGHEIGNHTWTHPVLTKLSAAVIQKEFDSTEQALVNTIGQNSTVFRPPYGAINDSVRALIPRQTVNWTIDTLDWKHRDPNKLLPMVKSTLHNNAIVLMHDIHQSTADGLEPVLQYLQSEGYEFLTVSQILQDH